MATIKKSHANDHSNFRSLDPPPPLDEPLGGYIFVCNNDTMEEDLQRDLFGLPQKYQNSVRGIQTGMPLFLYNYTTRELHGIFEASSDGGLNIEPEAWENKDHKNGKLISRFPSQVRVKLREKKAPLTEAKFRPYLHHYDGPKFRLELSRHEADTLLDLFKGAITPPLKAGRAVLHESAAETAGAREEGQQQQQQLTGNGEDGEGEWEKVKVKPKGPRGGGGGGGSAHHRGAAAPPFGAKRASSPQRWRAGNASSSLSSSSAPSPAAAAATGAAGGSAHVSAASPALANGVAASHEGEGGPRGKAGGGREKGGEHRADLAQRWRSDPDTWTGSAATGGEPTAASTGAGGQDHDRRPAVASSSSSSAAASEAGAARAGAAAVGGGKAPLVQPGVNGVGNEAASPSAGGDAARAPAGASSVPARPSGHVATPRGPISFAAILKGRAEAALLSEAAQEVPSGSSQASTGGKVPPPASGSVPAAEGASVNGAAAEELQAGVTTKQAAAAPKGGVADGPHSGARGGAHGRENLTRGGGAAAANGEMTGREKVAWARKGGPRTSQAQAQAQAQAQGSEHSAAGAGSSERLPNGRPGQVPRGGGSSKAAHGPSPPGGGVEAGKLAGGKDSPPKIGSSANGSAAAGAAKLVGAEVRLAGGELANSTGAVAGGGAAGGAAAADLTGGKAAEAPPPVVRRVAWQGNDAAHFRRLADPDPLPAAPAGLASKGQVKTVEAGQAAPQQQQKVHGAEASAAHGGAPAEVPGGGRSSSPPVDAQRPAPSEASYSQHQVLQPVPHRGGQFDLHQRGHGQFAGQGQGQGQGQGGLRVGGGGRGGHLQQQQQQAKGIMADRHNGPLRKQTPPLKGDKFPPPLLPPPSQAHMMALPPGAASPAGGGFRVSTPPPPASSSSLQQQQAQQPHPQHAHMFMHPQLQQQPGGGRPHDRRMRQQSGYGDGAGGSQGGGMYHHRPIARGMSDPNLTSYGWRVQSPPPMLGPMMLQQQQLQPFAVFPLPPPALLGNAPAVHREILEYAEIARPSKEARLQAKTAVDLVRNVVQSLWEGSDVEVFGSFATGLALPNSDIDVAVVDAPPPPPSAEVMALSGARINAPLVRDLAAVLRVQPWCESLYTIETARIPVIKLRCQVPAPLGCGGGAVASGEGGAAASSPPTAAGEAPPAGGAGGGGSASAGGENASGGGEGELATPSTSTPAGAAGNGDGSGGPAAAAGRAAEAGERAQKPITIGGRVSVAMDITVAGSRSPPPAPLLPPEEKEKGAAVGDGAATTAAVAAATAGAGAAGAAAASGRGAAWQQKLEDARRVHNGAAAREFIIQKLRQLPALAPLVLLLKSYLHQRGLNDVYTGGLGSFSLTLMLIFYLERAPVACGPPPEPPVGASDRPLSKLRQVGPAQRQGGAAAEEDSSAPGTDVVPRAAAAQAPSDKTAGEAGGIAGSGAAHPAVAAENVGTAADGADGTLLKEDAQKAPAANTGATPVASSFVAGAPVSQVEGSSGGDSATADSNPPPPGAAAAPSDAAAAAANEELPAGGDAAGATAADAAAASGADQAGGGLQDAQSDEPATAAAAPALAGGGASASAGGAFAAAAADSGADSCAAGAEAGAGSAGAVAAGEATSQVAPSEAGEHSQASPQTGEEGSAAAPPAAPEGVSNFPEVPAAVEATKPGPTAIGSGSSSSSSSHREEEQAQAEGQTHGQEAGAAGGGRNSPGLRLRRGGAILEELPGSMRSVPPPNLGILLAGFLHMFGQDLDFSRVKIVLKGKNGLVGGVFWHDPSTRPVALWIDDPLRPGYNVGAGSFAMWHVQAALRDVLFHITQPRPAAGFPQQQDGPGGSSSSSPLAATCPLLDSAFTNIVPPSPRTPSPRIPSHHHQPASIFKA